MYIQASPLSYSRLPSVARLHHQPCAPARHNQQGEPLQPHIPAPSGPLLAPLSPVTTAQPLLVHGHHSCSLTDDLHMDHCLVAGLDGGGV